MAAIITTRVPRYTQSWHRAMTTRTPWQEHPPMPRYRVWQEQGGSSMSRYLCLALNHHPLIGDMQLHLAVTHRCTKGLRCPRAEGG